ncbi:MAG: tyrosine-type recombinase/integrase [Provencibacterium sp.]|jgi:integrase/recombinase XerC|nr:tyrosine-type recombinase/integrase [Provencibacterium sp.]
MLTIRGRSARTVEAYHVDLRLYLRYLQYHKVYHAQSDIPLEELSITDLPDSIICSVTLSDIYAFLNYTLSERRNIASVRARKVSALRSFYKYLVSKTQLLEENPLEMLEMPSIKHAVPRFLSLDESLDLLRNLPQGKNYERDYCILTLFLNCGMRLSELCGINMQDIRENTLRLLGKGNKERIVYLNDACLAAIERYKKVRSPSPKEPNALFISGQGQRLSPRRVEQIVQNGLSSSNLDGRGYSPHKLRHTAATLMYQHGGVDIRVLKEILGHANLSTTEIYTHVSDKQLERASSLSPLAHEIEKGQRQKMQEQLTAIQEKKKKKAGVDS